MEKKLYETVKRVINNMNIDNNVTDDEIIEIAKNAIMKIIDKILQKARKQSVCMFFLDPVIDVYDNMNYTDRFYSAKNAEEMKQVYVDLFNDAIKRNIGDPIKLCRALYFNEYVCAEIGFDPVKWFKDEMILKPISEASKSIIAAAAPTNNNPVIPPASSQSKSAATNNLNSYVNNFVAPAQSPNNISAGEVLSNIISDKNKPIVSIMQGKDVKNDNYSATIEEKVKELKKHFVFIPGKHKGVNENYINGLMSILKYPVLKNAMKNIGVKEDISTLTFNEVEISKYPTQSDIAFDIAFECNTSSGTILLKYNTNCTYANNQYWYNFYLCRI